MLKRETWFEGQLDLDPERLVFIDETPAFAGAGSGRPPTWRRLQEAPRGEAVVELQAEVRRYGRCPWGERLRVSVPHGHWKTSTFVGALTLCGFAPFVLDGAINRDAFETYDAKLLVPELRAGDIVVMDNLPGHTGPSVGEMIKAAGARLLHLPPYSPDFNPIENAFAKLKALLRKAAERTIGALWNRIGLSLDAFTPAECANSFAAAGYDQD